MQEEGERTADRAKGRETEIGKQEEIRSDDANHLAHTVCTQPTCNWPPSLLFVTRHSYVRRCSAATGPIHESGKDAVQQRCVRAYL